MTDIAAICIAAVLCVLLLTIGWGMLMFILWKLVCVASKAVDKFKLKRVKWNRSGCVEGEKE